MFFDREASLNTYGRGRNFSGGSKTMFKSDKEVARKSMKMLNVFLLSVHVVFFIFFAFNHATIMMVMNIFSVLSYLCCFPLIKKHKTSVQTLVTFFEIMIHMFLAVICMGSACGFQLYFIGCTAIIFYADYFSVRLVNRHIGGIAMSICSGCLYFLSQRVAKGVGVLYPVSEGMQNTWMTLNSCAVFIVCIYFYSMLTGIANYYEEELARQANHDKLTGLVNRFYLIDHLQQVYNAGNMKNYWLAIVDIDDFKVINDSYGHNCGDFVLKSMTSIIQSCCGDLTACRWGGEEFVMVGAMPGGLKAEMDILETIRATVAEREFVYDGNRIKLTITIGAAPYMENQTIDEWIGVADEKLYTGKHSGKNQVVI